jgi:tetratricopeptide (TPR) repeat protein
MDCSLEAIKELINQGATEEAIERLDSYLLTCTTDKDKVYYLKGNAYRKLGNWQQALNCYQSAIDLNSESAAMHARDAIKDILSFYNKDMYNQ